MTALKSFLRNPVMMREARVRMRGWRAPALITLYVGLLSAVVSLLYYVYIRSEGPGGFAPEFGAITFMFLAMAQLGLLVMAAPGLTAGAISGERERQTLDLLLVTRMSPAQVVIGKLFAAVGFALLLMFASLPVYAMLFLYGGFSFSRLGLAAIVYLVTVLLLGSIGIYFSAVFKRTQAAVVASYAVTLGTIIATPILSVIFYQVLRFSTPDWKPPIWPLFMAYINPVFALAAAVGDPLSEINTVFNPVLTSPESQEAIWWIYCLVSLGIMALLLWRTTVRIRPLKNT